MEPFSSAMLAKINGFGPKVKKIFLLQGTKIQVFNPCLE